jgi:hypothetical protein
MLPVTLRCRQQTLFRLRYGHNPRSFARLLLEPFQRFGIGGDGRFRPKAVQLVADLDRKASVPKAGDGEVDFAVVELLGEVWWVIGSLIRAQRDVPTHPNPLWGTLNRRCSASHMARSSSRSAICCWFIALFA